MFCSKKVLTLVLLIFPFIGLYPKKHKNKISAEFLSYQKAADQGNVDAQFNLGCCYDNGIGVEQDCIKAVEWYQKAADQGHVGAAKALEEINKN